MMHAVINCICISCFLFLVHFDAFLSSGNTKLISPHVKMNSLRQNAEIKPCFTL